MRLTATSLLAFGLLGWLAPSSHAEIRHYASRMLDGQGSHIAGFAGDEDANLFIAARSGALPYDYVIVKLDNDGDEIWSRTVVRSVVDPFAIAATGDGGVFVTGGSNSSVDFGAGPMTSPFGDRDVFVVKLDEQGAVAWQHLYSARMEQYARAAAVDADGNIVIIGTYGRAIDFGGGPIPLLGGTDVFLAKFDTDGNHLWSRGIGKAGVQVGLALTIRDDRIAMSCRLTSGSITFDDTDIVNRGETDIVAAVFDGDGTYLWSRHAFSTLSEEAVDVALDPNGNAFLCGQMTRSLDLGGELLVSPQTATRNGFVASYDSLGAHRWSYHLPDSSYSEGLSIGANALGECVVLGHNWTPFFFGVDLIPRSDLSLLVFDVLGRPSDGIGYQGIDHAPRLLVDRTRDRITLAVNLYLPVDFGGGPLEPGAGRSLALVDLGVRRPAKVAVTRLDARTGEAGIELDWEISSDEPLGDYWLSRRIDNSAGAEILLSAPATEGESSFIDRATKPGHVHTYRLTVSTALGDDVVSEPVSVSVPLAITALEQNAPNPFNPLTRFAYSLAQPASVSIVIYDSAGALVAKLDQGMQTAGKHEAAWGGHNMGGNPVASGVYFYRLVGAGDVAARKMVLLK